MSSIVQHRTHRRSSKLGLHGAAVFPEHGVVTFEAPNTAPALITRFARNAMPGVKATLRQQRGVRIGILP
jgi:hypothetical protein